jgi:hypothetical protein
MPIDIAAMAAQAREYYLSIGIRYPTQSVLLQGDKTQQGLVKHAAILVDFGFALRDGARMVEACERVRASVVGRAVAGGSRKLTGKNYRSASRNARLARRSAITALSAAIPDLLETGQEAAAQLVQTTLEATSALPGGEELPKQLQLLFDVLVQPVVDAAVADRGGPGIARRLDTSRTALLAALRERAGQSPVSAAAEERDILEGIVVSLARNASKAARVAARSLGQPSIALDFKLTYLDPARNSGSEDDPGSDTPSDPDAPEGPEAPETP